MLGRSMLALRNYRDSSTVQAVIIVIVYISYENIDQCDLLLYAQWLFVFDLYSFLEDE